jgi:predicted deacylase
MFAMIRYAMPILCAAAIFSPLAASAGEVYNRELHQEQRIFTGVKDDQLNWAQFRNLERRELAVNAQRVADLHRHDGHLTYGEYGHLNRELNGISTSIYRNRHN